MRLTPTAYNALKYEFCTEGASMTLRPASLVPGPGQDNEAVPAHFLIYIRSGSGLQAELLGGVVLADVVEALGGEAKA